MAVNLSMETSLQEDTPLIKAITRGDYELVKSFIHAGVDVNIPGISHFTALHYAITNPEIAHLLIKHGANVNATNFNKQTPLHLAVDKECLESVYMLLYYNADADSQDWRGFTPFMRAIEVRNIELQEVLIEYVVDFNVRRNDNWSLLGLALARNSPFIDEIIMRGADVNNVNGFENGALYLPFQLSRAARGELINAKTFKLIWDSIDYIVSRNGSVLGGLVLVGISRFEQFLDVIIHSDKFPQVTESVYLSDDLHTFTNHYAKLKLPLEKYTEVFCMLLTCGYTPTSFDMVLLFNLYGYCELYRWSLFMDIRNYDEWIPASEKIPTRLMYEVRYGQHRLLKELIYMLSIKSAVDDSLSLVIVRLLDYCMYPKLVDAYLKLNKTDCATLKMNALPKVPSLTELARNEARDHIKGTFGVRSSCQLHTLINYLDISQEYKKILTFEKVLYKPTYTDKEFKKYIKIMKKCDVDKNVLRPLIRSERINSNINNFKGD